ncbi:MAG: thiamine-phosphate kinase [Desulfosudaceae bacterium]
MPRAALEKRLKFYFITDDKASLPIPDQVRAAIAGGATMVQYRHKNFYSGLLEEASEARLLCRTNHIPFIVNDDPILARALGADGVHLGQEDLLPAEARRIMGEQALIGLSVSTLAELERADTGPCDYLGTGPVFTTASKKDAKPVIGLDGLGAVIAASPLPVVAIGGIDDTTAASCLAAGAAGVAVISFISRSGQPRRSAAQLAAACGISHFSGELQTPWQDEFELIAQLLSEAPPDEGRPPVFEVPPGDDAAVLKEGLKPVITTDAHIQGIHFNFDWQTPEEAGYKAAVSALSDLAASYARPVAMFVNLTLPPAEPGSLARMLYRGLNRALREYDCALGGGNLAAGGEVSLNLFIVGQKESGLYPARANARPGQGLYSTGRLGMARAGLELLRHGRNEPAELLAAFKYPRARFDEAAVLAENGVDCVIDISDGLAGDAAHIARAAGVTMAMDLSAAVYDPLLLDYCGRSGLSPEIMVLKGGEDYELLFTCEPERFETIRQRLPRACRVGRCESFTGRELTNIPIGLRSFQHGGEGRYDHQL